MGKPNTTTTPPPPVAVARRNGNGLMPSFVEAQKPVVLRMHPELAARAHAWAEATIGKMSTSAAVACAVREALPVLEKRGSLHNFPDVTFMNSGCLIGPLDDEAE